jgi:hypothetical protein
MENVVQYQENYVNLTTNGTSPNEEAKIPGPGTFSPGYFIEDIVTVNGQKSRGTTMARDLWFNLNPNLSGSQGIADINRFQAMDVVLEIQQADGSSVGTIFLSGVTGGAPPLGAPKAAPTGNFAVVGGTGAFLGARGQAATIMNSHRATSTFENPINRRNFPAGLWKMAVQLIPMNTPEVVVNNGAPVIAHGTDYSPVTATNPAHPGRSSPECERDGSSDRAERRSAVAACASTNCGLIRSRGIDVHSTAAVSTAAVSTISSRRSNAMRP